ncbi:hypothetical protein [Aquimarina sp. 2201CG5-10]|uniref:hypothetical protein n=1 Tax=Aquimarina callyspongiae TaxID=3098150 RepID=UPI002AB42422|nr:hypothetical protein [Aquimarina sp. 2201CG5-10]MDY8138846.1 hypothetical protein [Aquimarina sp. 2201CG5-10]
MKIAKLNDESKLRIKGGSVLENEGTDCKCSNGSGPILTIDDDPEDSKVINGGG